MLCEQEWTPTEYNYHSHLDIRSRQNLPFVLIHPQTDRLSAEFVLRIAEIDHFVDNFFLFYFLPCSYMKEKKGRIYFVKKNETRNLLVFIYGNVYYFLYGKEKREGF